MNKHKHHIIPRYKCKELGIVMSEAFVYLSWLWEDYRTDTEGWREKKSSDSDTRTISPSR